MTAMSDMIKELEQKFLNGELEHTEFYKNEFYLLLYNLWTNINNVSGVVFE